MFLLTFVTLILCLYLVYEAGCRDVPPAAGVSWFVISKRLQVSKKARTRGDVVGGLTRRERRLRHIR